MQARNSASEQPARSGGRTFTESARRAQIVQAAIEVIADHGYANASFTKIAKQAGLSSTGMISYHFSGKDDLMGEVVAEVLRLAGAHMMPIIGAAEGFGGRLRAYIESNIELLQLYPKHLLAVTEVLANLKGDSPQAVGFIQSQRATLDAQAQIMRAAQAAGVFRDFDPEVMALAIRGSIDALVVRCVADPSLDSAAYGRELADIFDIATRSTQP
jgi:AcrR family transcriptional regulator